jgi:hypothetical protein
MAKVSNECTPIEKAADSLDGKFSALGNIAVEREPQNHAVHVLKGGH